VNGHFSIADPVFSVVSGNVIKPARGRTGDLSARDAGEAFAAERALRCFICFGIPA
jgi:hypothetical protein